MSILRLSRPALAAGLVALVCTLTAAGSVAPAGASASPAGGGSGTRAAAACTRQFHRAVHRYVQTTEDRDARGFNALLDRDATVVFANGGVLSGKPDVSAFITDFFADPGWTQTFRQLDEHVEGCRTGFVLFDSVYSVPAQERVSPLVIGVSFTYEHGRWLVLHNQDSNGPAS